MRFGSLALFSLLAGAAYGAQTAPSRTYELRGGWWFDGRAFARRTLYVADGMFRADRPARIDSVIALGDAWVVPPYGDAHTHAFDNPATIGATVEAHRREGIFYALSLTNSIAGKRAVAAQVNHPAAVDVAYADAGLTSDRGHPIMSAEMTANRWPWDSLGVYWGRLLHSRKAEGDVYFVIGDTGDVRRQWSRVVASRPDLIKIFLLDTERFETLRRDTMALGHIGLDPAVVPAIVAAAHRDGLRVGPHRDRRRLPTRRNQRRRPHRPPPGACRPQRCGHPAICHRRGGCRARGVPRRRRGDDRLAGDTGADCGGRHSAGRPEPPPPAAQSRAAPEVGVPLAIGSDLFVTASTE